MKHKLLGIIQVLTIFFCSIICILIISSIINISLTSYEKYQAKPVGKMISLNNRKLHLYTQGNSGKNIILLPGLGTPSPVYDYARLANKLKEKYIVTIVEPYGYGWSDTTSSIRSNENIVDDIRQSLLLANIKPPYIIIPHSISGLYTLYYANKYPNEIDGIVCLDTSVPEQIKLYKKGSNLSLNYQFLRDTGLIRLGLLIYPKLYPIHSSSFTQEESKIILMFCNWNVSNRSVQNETDMVKTNLENLQGIKFPDTIPILMFLSIDTINNIKKLNLDLDWKAVHINQLNKNINSKVQILPGSHYIHHDNSDEIAKQIFLTF
jgi:pimeloyl-ACP methyl ester carboxylesterase